MTVLSFVTVPISPAHKKLFKILLFLLNYLKTTRGLRGEVMTEDVLLTDAALRWVLQSHYKVLN